MDISSNSFKEKTNKKRQYGATLVEYALIVALIAIVAIVGVKLVGKNVNQLFQNAADDLPTAGGDGGGN